MAAALHQSSLASLPFLHRGKVRDLYAVGDDQLLVIQTDRLSAFDVVLPTPVPGKGRVLTALSNFWFKQLGHVIPNHLIDNDPESVVAPAERDQVAGRAMVVRRLKPLPIEAIARGYVIGSGWKDYRKTGAICGIELPAGLREAEKLPRPDLHPIDEGHRRPRRKHPVRRSGQVARSRARERGARGDAAPLHRGG